MTADVTGDQLKIDNQANKGEMSSAGGIRRPIQIEEFTTAIKDMGDAELVNIAREIENSIRHLERSNHHLNAYITKIQGDDVRQDSRFQDEVEDLDENDLKVFQESMKENEMVLQNYNERLDALSQEHIYRKSGSSCKGIPSTAGKEAVLNINSKTIDMDNTKVDTVAPNSIYL